MIKLPAAVVYRIEADLQEKMTLADKLAHLMNFPEVYNWMSDNDLNNIALVTALHTGQYEVEETKEERVEALLGEIKNPDDRAVVKEILDLLGFESRN